MSMWGQRQRELTGGEPGEVAVPSSSAAQQAQPTANRTAASESTALVSAPANAPTAVAAASPPVKPKAPVCMVRRGALRWTRCSCCPTVNSTSNMWGCRCADASSRRWRCSSCTVKSRTCTRYGRCTAVQAWQHVRVTRCPCRVCAATALTQKNLEAAAKKKAQEAASAGLYRDRAAERRKLYVACLGTGWAA